MFERKAKSKKLTIFIVVILLLCIGIGVFIWWQYHQVDEEVRDDDSSVEIAVIEPDTDDVGDSHSSDFDKHLLRKIDFDYLQSINSDVATWVYIPETIVDSYVMQEPVLNEYKYDKKTISLRYSSIGSYLIPKEPVDDVVDAHTLILGHNFPYSNAKFSKNPIYYRDEERGLANDSVYLYYPDHSERWKVWTVSDVKGDDIVFELPYELGTDRYEDLLDHMIDTGRYEINTAPDKWTKTLMLSTCNRRVYGASGRFVIVCVPDVSYYYDTKTAVDYEVEHQRILRENAG